jgi:SAM-dependent methyltransferase
MNENKTSCPEHVRLKNLLARMRIAYAEGRNAMAVGRGIESSLTNDPLVTLLGYDLQAGSYVDNRRISSSCTKQDSEIASFIAPYVSDSTSILEVGCGEATRLTGVHIALRRPQIKIWGLDISWSRLTVGRSWLVENKINANLLVASLFNIPLHDSSIDIVYTSHSIEPNGGREEQALQECFRVANKALIIVEPIYELASKEAQERMRSHGYARNLEKLCHTLPGKITHYGLLRNFGKDLNPTGIIVIEKQNLANRGLGQEVCYRCPITEVNLNYLGDVLFSPDSCLAYPILRGIPLLRAEHAVVASKLI